MKGFRYWRLRAKHWLIRKLAGDGLIVLNAEIRLPGMRSTIDAELMAGCVLDFNEVEGAVPSIRARYR